MNDNTTIDKIEEECSKQLLKDAPYMTAGELAVKVIMIILEEQIKKNK